MDWTQVISTYKGHLHIINNNNNTYVSNSRIQHYKFLSRENFTINSIFDFNYSLYFSRYTCMPLMEMMGGGGDKTKSMKSYNISISKF